jgi:hypothetical protein
VPLLPEENEKLGLMYSYHQVLSRYGNATFRTIVGASIFTGSVVLILCFYGLIKFHHEFFNVLMLGGFEICVFIGSEFCLRMSIRIYYHSEAFLKGAQNNPSVQGKYDHIVWRSRRPISISVGNLFEIETKNFLLRLFGEVILQNICSLSLTFP